MTDATTESTTPPEPAQQPNPTAKLIKAVLPLLVALTPATAALHKSSAADDAATEAQTKLTRAWTMLEPSVNSLIDREREARAERLELAKEVAKLAGTLAAKGIVPTSRAEVVDGPKPVLLEGEKKDPPKDKGKDAPKKPKPKPDPKPKKPPIKKLPTTLTC